MSVATDIADREARAAELEAKRAALTDAELLPDGATDEQVDELHAALEAAAGEAAPEPTPEPSSAEATAKALDKEMSRHEKALAKVLELELPLEQAPFEGVIGFVLPGMLELRENDRYQRCTTCNGQGSVLTGSMRAGQETVDCPDDRCKGRGYWAKATTPAIAATTPPAGNGAVEAEWEKPTWLGDTTIQPT